MVAHGVSLVVAAVHLLAWWRTERSDPPPLGAACDVVAPVAVAFVQAVAVLAMSAPEPRRVEPPFSRRRVFRVTGVAASALTLAALLPGVRETARPGAVAFWVGHGLLGTLAMLAWGAYLHPLARRIPDKALAAQA